MALRDQPYFPFYVDDYLTDEKLVECSAESQGVYIRILCIMHKSEEYGVILLRQKDKQSDQQVLNFAEKLAKHMPFKIDIIKKSLIELIEEDVLQQIGDKLLQKRMIRDNSISLSRSEAGSKGGFATAKKTANIIAKDIANTVNANECVIENVIKDKIEIRSEDFKNSIKPFIEKYSVEMCRAFFEYWSEPNPSKTKMRFELQKTWEISRRLNTWASRQEVKNNFNKSTPPQSVSDVYSKGYENA
jgi:hypothetical protein